MLHASGLHTANFTDVSEATYDLGMYSPPPPPPGVAALPAVTDPLTFRGGKTSALWIKGLGDGGSDEGFHPLIGLIPGEILRGRQS